MLEAWQTLQPWPCVFLTALVGECLQLWETPFPAFCTSLSPGFARICLQTEGLDVSLWKTKAEMLQHNSAAGGQLHAKCHMPQRWHLVNLLGPNSSCHRRSGAAVFLGLHTVGLTDSWRDSRWELMEKVWASVINTEVQLLLAGPCWPCVSRWSISQSNACSVAPCWCRYGCWCGHPASEETPSISETPVKGLSFLWLLPRDHEKMSHIPCLLMLHAPSMRQSAAIIKVDVGTLEFDLIALSHLIEDRGWWRFEGMRRGGWNCEMGVACLRAEEGNPGKVLDSISTQTFTDAHRDQRETIWLNLSAFLHCYIIFTR